MQDRYKSDLFAGKENNLIYLIDPFFEEIKISCIIKTKRKDDKIERTECHDMVLVCPCINPNFAYLGNSNEVNFGKVYVGCKSRILLEIQNISSKRISPTISLLNPISSFSCGAFLKKLEVDPEHVWYYPLTYAPKEAKGVEKEFFEIYCESTNIFLMAKGEAIEPQCRIMPTTACYLLESRLGNYEEIKIEVENFSSINLPLLFATDFVKEGFETEKTKEPELGAITKEKPLVNQNEGRKRKKTNSARKKLISWEEVPDWVLLMQENFQEIENDTSTTIFTLIGCDDNQKIEVPALAKSIVKIRFSPPYAEEKEELNLIKKYVAKFKIILEGSGKFFKEITIIGVIPKIK